jgi:hypothetical protein
VTFAFVLRRFALLLPLIVLALPVHAQSLYTGTIPVTSQAEAERAEALKSALAQVVVKLTGGDNAVLARPEVAQAIANAANYVQQYQYVQNAVTVDGKPQTSLSLVAQFDSSAVDKMIADLGLTHGGGDGGGAGNATAQAEADVSAQTYRVWVDGLHSATDYARVVGALVRNELVRDVRAEQARGDGMELELDVTGPLPRLLQSLAGSPLQVLNAKPPIDGVDALLQVRP